MSIVVENLSSQRLAPDLRDESPDGGGATETGKAPAEEVDECGGLLFPSQSCSSSSSIGKNSDLESEEEDGGGEEVQSSYNGSLNSINDLEEALPIRRGISSFYNGKSRSFMSLAEASSTPSITEIAKPEDAYTRKRKNQLAFRHGWDRTGSGSICKRPIRASRSTLALAVAMGSSDSISSNDSSSSSDGASLSPAAMTAALPPLRQRARLAGAVDSAPWRSFSVADLRQCHGRV